MDLQRYRPWGRLDWVLSRLPGRNWRLLGCIGTEERCLTAWRTFKATSSLAAERMLDVRNRLSPKFSALAETRRDEMMRTFAADGGPSDAISEHHLEEREENIFTSISEFLVDASEDVVVDFSTLPKRFFFPIFKTLINEPRLKNLLATYTVPITHSPGKLAENLMSWRPLPMFRPPDPEPDDRMMIVGLGFDPLGLPDLLGQDLLGTDIRLLFPISGGPPGFRRNWEFVRRIEAETGKTPYTRIPVSAYDMSDVFDHLKKETENGSRYTILAPYGPKPMSLAMCVFATLNPAKTSVFYTQPTEYNPDYSIGVKFERGQPLTYAYCLKLNGRALYTA